MDIDEPAWHDQSGRWFRHRGHGSGPVEIMPHEAAALFVLHYKPIPPALAPVVRELLDGTAESSPEPPPSRQRAPREPAPHELYAFDLVRSGKFTQADIAKKVRQKFRRPCDQGQVSKWVTKVRAWNSGEIFAPYPRHRKRTVNLGLKSLERRVADRSGEHVDEGSGLVAACGGGTRVVRKLVHDPNGWKDD